MQDFCYGFLKRPIIFILEKGKNKIGIATNWKRVVLINFIAPKAVMNMEFLVC